MLTKNPRYGLRSTFPSILINIQHSLIVLFSRCILHFDANLLNTFTVVLLLWMVV